MKLTMREKINKQTKNEILGKREECFWRLKIEVFES